MDIQKQWQVHRFNAAVACHLGTGGTVYMSPASARALAKALTAAALSVNTEAFKDSKCGTSTGPVHGHYADFRASQAVYALKERSDGYGWNIMYQPTGTCVEWFKRKCDAARVLNRRYSSYNKG
jgi:hypothetical protein